MITTPAANNRIVLRRTEDGEPRTNVPRTVVHHSPTGFEWGYPGSGPADLALNIVEFALTNLSYRGRRNTCFKGSCWDKAWEFHQDFKFDFLVTMPPQGGEIPFSVVKQWIHKKM